MSSLRNSLHRRNHKERSQLAHRSRLGILEKHKDYVLRARDYHSKQDRITRLRQKAADRNKDEFYFGMTRQRTEGGVHVQDRGNEALPVDIVKVLKSQDGGYIRTMRTAGLKKIDRLKGHLSALADLFKANPLVEADDETTLNESELNVLRDAGIIAPSLTKQQRRKSESKHIVFADNEDEASKFASSSTSSAGHDDISMAVEEPEDTWGWKEHEDMSATRKHKGKSKADANLAVSAVAERREEALNHRTRLLKELSARLTRDRQLRYAERELEMQKLLMGKGASRKLSGVEKVEDADEDEGEDSQEERRPKKVDEKTWKPRVYKWRVERKR